jgi:hypothetical protein
MFKKIIMLLVIATLSLNCSTDHEGQNLDISVTGKVTNQNNVGIIGISIYVYRGRSGNFVGPVYELYETLTTNSNGNYSYLVKNDTYTYEICCGIPFGYFISGDNCQSVNHNIIDSHTIPNIINFRLTQ